MAQTPVTHFTGFCPFSVSLLKAPSLAHMSSHSLLNGLFCAIFLHSKKSVYVYAFVCEQVHVHEYMHAEATGQPWLLSLGHYALSFWG